MSRIGSDDRHLFGAALVVQDDHVVGFEGDGFEFGVIGAPQLGPSVVRNGKTDGIAEHGRHDFLLEEPYLEFVVEARHARKLQVANAL
ncbi:hypothetical protein [Nocardiopsis sp. LOL_012]|uniref:hypothetical protein n=1 Tax=Nocardiopsis sp. LOL_012 TaxID=3345409 RepID=UPI003A8A3746